MVPFVIGALIGLLGVTISTAQTPPRIVSSAASGGALRLHWTGSAPSYAVQGTRSLTAPEWQPLLLTARTNATLPLPGGMGFFRVQALTTGALEISDDRRFEILDAISRKIESLPGTNDVVESRELASFVSSHAELIGAGVAKDTSVWGRFRDGRLLFIVNNRPPATGEELSQIERLISTASTSGVSPSSEVALASAMTSSSRPAPHGITRVIRPTGLPESRNAVLFQATGGDLRAPALARLAPAFQARGYQVQGGEAGLFDLMSVKELGDDLGVFYIDTHGVSVPGVIPFALLTSTPVERETHGRLQENFDRAEIAYVFTGPKMVPKGGVGIAITPKPLYCILPPFVPAYWKFGRNSLAYMDVCHSASSDAATFLQLCAEAGASVYMGWTDAVDDYWALYAARIFLGTSMGDRDHLVKIATPTRSFDWPAIVSYMVGKRINISPRSDAELILFADTPSANGRFGLLAPSIYSMNVDEAREELRIVGLFDPEVPATVRVEGNGAREVTASVRPNSHPLHPWQILCPLPAREQPTAGLVTVVQRGRASNPVPLTEWRLEGRGRRWFSPGSQDPRATVDFELHFRADVHRSRAVPYQNPVFPGASAAASRASTARVVEASGIYLDVNASNPNFVRTVEWSLPGPIDLPVTHTGFLSVDRGFYGSLGIVPDGNVDFLFTSKAANDITVIETQISPGGRSEIRYPIDAGVRTFPWGKTRLDFTTYALQSGTGPAAGNSGEFSWAEASASFPPEAKTAASVEPTD